MEKQPVSVKAVFDRALELVTAEERAAYLDEACAGAPELRQKVEALLEAYEAAGSFLERPVMDSGTTADLGDSGCVSTPSPPHAGATVFTEGPGTRIGPYTLLHQIGAGGMGAVWMAEQTEPVRRLVALKVIKAGMDSAPVVARFEAERQALALMDHPHIARVFDGGTTASGRPFFVMELVKGTPITKYCDEHRLSPRERLELFVPVCQALQHAHQKGIIHRDIKPSNVLVAPCDGKPMVKVIDFGVAKAAGQRLTERTLVTVFGMVVGTLEYMSPEQAELTNPDIDTRSDVYSLGVLLYELLTGSTPLTKQRLKETPLPELLRLIREEEPPRPSTRLSTTAAAPSVAANRGLDPKRLSALVRGELDWIVMKALEKDRNRRYESASAFAADVQRYLDDEPVLACPPSAWYRLRKFVRRHKTALTVAGLILFVVAALGGGVGWVVRDRWARQARIANDLELVLERADLLQGQGKLAEARAEMNWAEKLADEVPPDPARDKRLAALKERLDAEARDQDFMARFEDIRLRVQSQVDVGESRFIDDGGYRETREALRQYGIAIGDMAPAQAAARIRERPGPVRRSLIAALNECFYAPKADSQTRRWLLAALDADDDAWRVQIRKAGDGGDWKVLVQLTREVDVRKQPPSFLLLVAWHFPTALKSHRLELLRRTQRAYPDDWWANYGLALGLQENGRPGEAARYYTGALALRPNNPGLYLNRGQALRGVGEVDAAIEDYQQCLALAPRYAEAHYCLGLALYAKGRVAEAVAEYREAICLKGHHAELHYNLGLALCLMDQLDDAIAAYRQAIGIKKDYAEAHCNLGEALRRQGEFRKALEELRRGHELGSKKPGWPYPTAQWVRQCERLVELDERLPGFLEGKTTPANPNERIELAEVCALKRLNRAAVRLYEDAFAAEPRLADDPRTGHRHEAARAAARAGCGAGQDTDKLDGKERARLRGQALDWLRADLDGWRRLIIKGQDKTRAAAVVTEVLRYWLADASFASVRGREALAKLPEAERQPWQKLWDDVAHTLAQAKTTTVPEKKSDTK
jgi:serine/threonine protein kinase/tetratricopeptide (TPR) repeat protein